MFTDVESLAHFEQIVSENEGVLFYFSHAQCNVCKVLKPKVAELINENFPKIALYYVDTKNNAEIAAQKSIFAVPTLLVFLNGDEFIRKSRNVGIDELYHLIERPYHLLFS